MKRSAFVAQTGAVALAGAAVPAASQTLDTVNIGSVNSVADTPFVVADRKGYFRDVGLNVELKFFDAAQPIAVATTATSIVFQVHNRKLDLVRRST